MKTGEKVKHVNLINQIGLRGMMFKKTLFDGPESLHGIVMHLCPVGVLCHYKDDAFVIPYAQIGTIILEEEDSK